MKRSTIASVTCLGLALLASGAMAKQRAKAPTCQQIEQAIKSGKTDERVAKDLKTSISRVQKCTKEATASHAKAR